MDHILQSIDFEELFEQFCEEYVKQYNSSKSWQVYNLKFKDPYFNSFLAAREEIAKRIYGKEYEYFMMEEFYLIIEDLDWFDRAKDLVM